MHKKPLRQQYHFQRYGDDIFIWDVHRLIELSSYFDVVDIKLSDISELYQAYWFGGESIKATCKAIGEHAKLINEASLDYPIILSDDGRVMDGMHRVTKASMLGLETIKAVQFPENPSPDYKNIDEDKLPYD